MLSAYPHPGRALALGLILGWWSLGPVTGLCESDEQFRDEETIQPDKIHVLDGSYVLDMGNFHVNITNHGLIGSQYTAYLPYSRAPSGEWPGGSGHEYLWGAGLWVGANIRGDIGVTTGQPER